MKCLMNLDKVQPTLELEADVQVQPFEGAVLKTYVEVKPAKLCSAIDSYMEVYGEAQHMEVCTAIEAYVEVQLTGVCSFV